MKSNFSFLPFFKVLWHRLFWIVIVAVIGAGSGYFILKQTYVPKYSISSTVDVHRVKTLQESNLDRYNTDVNRIGTIQSEMGDTGVYASASKLMKKYYNVSVSVKTMQNNVTVSGKPSSTILGVGATSTSAYKASLIVNSVIRAYKVKYTKLDKRLVVRQLSRANPAYATVSKAPYGTYMKNGAAIGAIIAYVFFLILYYFKSRKIAKLEKKQNGDESAQEEADDKHKTSRSKKMIKL